MADDLEINHLKSKDLAQVGCGAGEAFIRMFYWLRRLRFANRRTIWCPTWLGAWCIATVLVTPVVWWCIWGEAFLSSNRPIPAEELVVEGWIGLDALHAAAEDTKQYGYQYVVVTGGPTSERWEEHRWNYAEMAAKELIRLGVPKEKIIAAPAEDRERRRTFESAVAARRVLEAKGISAVSVNVFTLGPHARRSQLVFAKVFGRRTKVGVIAWSSPDYQTVPWWHSSERSREMLTESAAYLFEAVFNSGRPI
jgi:hypothetical protein